MDRCPRSDPSNIGPGGIFEVKCPACGESIEFFKDEADRKCSACGEKVTNPNAE